MAVFMKQCSACKNVYEDSLKFCLVDGTPLSEGGGTNANSTSGLERKAKEQSLTRMQTGLLAACGLVLLAGAVLVILFRLGSQSDSLKNTEGKVHASNVPRNSYGNTLPDRNVASPYEPSNSNARPWHGSQVSNDDRADTKGKVAAAIERWREAGEARDVDLLVRSYADTINYYRRRAASKNFVRQDKQRAYLKYDSIKLKVDIIDITINEEGDRADATIDKEWIFRGGGFLAGKVRQDIGLRSIDGQWLITDERDIKVYYVNK